MIKPQLVSIAIPLWVALALVSVQAQSPFGTLHGVTVNADGTPIASVPVVIHRNDDNSERTVVSGFDGAFSVSNLQPGRYEVKATKGELHSASAILDLPAQQDLKVDLALAGSMETNDISPAVAKKLAAMEAMEARMAARIEQLEAELKTKTVSEQPSTPAARGDLVATLTKDPSQIPIVPATLANPDMSKTVASAAGSRASAQDAKGQPASIPPAAPAVDNQTPFAFGDFTWLNGSPRNKDVVFDSPFFTPEVRFDTEYMEDFNQPKDHTIVGATESFRSGEVQVEQASVGGDFHWQNVRGRILFMDGLFASTTPRNDASSATGSAPGNTGGVGQWDLQSAYKYVSEAYGGYHFNVNHGLNVDAGIFVSYIGLFSYYNFDNWTYQPSYVSSNTPWFFNGVRVQWFPTNKLKIEPWFINGWQSYAKFNGHPGLGGQLLWEPREWFKLVANQYGFGQDNLGLPHTERIHTDDSIEVRYYNHPESTGITKMAFSLTGDAGGQYGGGLCATCGSASGSSTQKEAFIGWMLYDRTWWHHDTLGLTLGGGYMNNPGRYLTLLPPIDGATAASGTPYFTELPGQPAHMWDSTVTLQYMPKQYITWWAEVGYRHSDIPYFAGRGGVTPPGGNNGAPQYYTCANGATSGTGNLTAAQTACGGAGNVWFPDLVRSEAKLSVGVLVKF
jgi:Putative beta-barrel porin-2, OmpL-like. bbp2/Carboxypeptidase regulatory-like domain